MRCTKILSSVSAIILLSAAPVTAVDFRYHNDTTPPNIHKTGWDQRNLQMQTEGSVYLRAEIEDLKKQNEQLRNSLSQLRHDHKNKAQNYANEMKYETRIQALVEENKRLNKLINTRPQNNSSKEADIYAREIRSLKMQNAELQKNINQLSAAARAHVPKNTDELNAYKKENENLRQALSQMKTIEKNKNYQEVLTLKQSVSKLESENRSMAQALANATDQTLKYQAQIQDINQNGANESRQKSQFKRELQSAQKKIETLEKNLEQARSEKASALQTNNGDLDLLKQQNKSLRETIKSQSELLVSSGNASNAAEQLISENLMLKRKLEQADQSSDFNGKTAKQLFAQTQKMQAEIAQRDKYIQELEGLKETVKQLRNQNDIYLSNANKNRNQGNEKKLTEMINVNKSLEEALEKERETTIAYRSKIREYQDQVNALQNNNEVKRQQKQREQIDNLKAENETLKSQIEDLTQQVSANRGKDTAVFANMDKVKSKDVTYIDTPYPPVETVLPVLGKNGEHIDYSQTSEVKAEDLLSRAPEPLSGGND